MKSWWKAWWKEGQRLNRGMKFIIIHHEFHNENHYEFHHTLTWFGYEACEINPTLTIHYAWNSLWNEYQLDLKWIWIILNELNMKFTMKFIKKFIMQFIMKFIVKFTLQFFSRERPGALSACCSLLVNVDDKNWEIRRLAINTQTLVALLSHMFRGSDIKLIYNKGNNL